MKRNYIVIDTNVFISAIIGQNSFPKKIFEEIILTNEVRLCLSNSILAEYEEVIARKKFCNITGFQERAKDFIEKIKEVALIIEPKVSLDILSDKDDNMFLEIALEANVQYVVTGNINDFAIIMFRETKIVTPKEYYEEWQNSKLI